MSGRLQLQKLRFRAGSVTAARPLEIEYPNVIILVGPNSSGKSQTLREVEDWCYGRNPQFKVVDSIDVLWPTDVNEFEDMLRLCKAEPPEDQAPQIDHIWIAKPTVRSGEEAIYQQVNVPTARQYFESRNEKRLRQILTRLFTMRLDGRTRFDLIEPKEAGLWKDIPGTTFGRYSQTMKGEKKFELLLRGRLSDTLSLILLG